MKQPDEGNLFTDLMEFGPAPTMSRELVVLVITVALFAVIIAIAGPSVIFLVVTAVVAVYMGVRFVLGLREWGTR